jgi:uncharacterized membrane protein YgdD (TMEM256/DUF423 family)
MGILLSLRFAMAGGKRPFYRETMSSMTARFVLAAAALAMFLAVGAGAFGAHALRSRLTPDLSAVWQTAVQYHAWHALGLFGIGVLMLQWPGRGSLAVAAWLLLAGIVLFSGSLYALALTGVRGLGAVTPIGGVAFLAGWLAMAWACFAEK